MYEILPNFRKIFLNNLVFENICLSFHFPSKAFGKLILTMVEIIYLCSYFNLIWSYIIYVKLLSTVPGTLSTSFWRIGFYKILQLFLGVCSEETRIFRVEALQFDRFQDYLPYPTSLPAHQSDPLI